ncbi:phage tail terminator family protein [Cohnella abietis]|uniref:Phage protein n=1 Tax=Cohnella abietis TaxID=2507935 RepID=A0A3T1D1W3_9BACL|nr:hypothetical protein [Cohnella abietis]BBI32041.1 hypothetical protein KCTCHS21_14400 [Cohnella abietis]
MITVNDVLNGVTRALAEHFPDMPRYGEEIKQGLDAPCFFIKLFPTSQTREVGRRYLRTHTFDIHYFPNPAIDENEDAHDIAEQLYSKLEYLLVGNGQCRGTRMRHEVIDGVMHFFVSYDFHIMRPAPQLPKMQSIEQEVKLQ